MKFEINPYQSIGDFKFNALRPENREKLAEFNDDLYCHSRSDGKFPDDTYKNLGLEFIYTKYNVLGAMEMQLPANPSFQGKNLLELPWHELIAWFRKIDHELVESEKDFVSYKFGISGFSPEKDKNPGVLPTSVTVFEKDFFYQKNGVPNPGLLNSFFIHVPYLELFGSDKIEVESIGEAFSIAFGATRENGVFLWNQLPIAFSYSEDLAKMIGTIAELLWAIKERSEGKLTVEFNCPSFDCSWIVKWNEKYVLLDADWKRVKGGYEAALNDALLPTHQLTLLKSEFLAEWKIPLQQVITVLSSKQVTITDESAAITLQKLIKLEKWIPELGKFYSEEQNWITTNTDGRKEVNLGKLSFWKIALIVLFILALVLLPLYYFSRGEDSPFWAIDGIIRVFLIVLVVTVPITLLASRWMRKRNS